MTSPKSNSSIWVKQLDVYIWLQLKSISSKLQDYLEISRAFTITLSSACYKR